MHKPLIIDFVLVLAAAFFSTIAQTLIQAGAHRFDGSWVSYFLSPWVLAGMGCHRVVLLLFTMTFRSGGTVPLLYPVYAPS